MSEKPTQIKISLGHRRQILDEIAASEKRSVSETVCLLLDIILDNLDQIKEVAEVEKRTFIDMAQLWVAEGEEGKAAADFIKAIASNEQVSDTTCIKVARVLDVEPEQIIHLRNCIRDRQPNGK
ncbi:hypothetical protein VF14_03285 [Nostoc linckia z18]|jgi:hypothetical protein|uniref:Uncharacterized protein n=2 Tax=Nostoc linckia TaxID=92942 RepID=A0A9Q5ZH23_NOSLI|nr:hypothetical protein [Nostoc linckia]PHK42401.1 hypothetical protein VF12_03300 [Nostoc linckia z15]PHK46909.1 hypothetical protein VF13_07925 [Nostoc linckia z16]PHJ69171.1 hypothetical protein VF02_00755 [Nostoc linckia z1]PHJ73322.1 hypothetical protein VF05_01770 [Nostoc linckia z3]PHJ78669.1 hypothetical protein VF03_00755 [Nostoc linckia z2]